MSNQVQTESGSRLLEVEVNDLQIELQRLQTNREELARRPVFAQDAPAAEVAQRIVSTVSQNAGSLRAMDAAIEVLMERLTGKRSQLAQAQDLQRKAQLQQEIDQVRSEMADVCDRVNEASNYITEQVDKLKALETKLIPLRQRLNPNTGDYPYFVLSEPLSVPRATHNDIQTCLEPRPL